jgi:acetylxylan esterase
MNQKLTLVGFLLAACLGLFIASPSKAASLQLVTADWGTNGVPTNVSMYIYVPDKVVTNPPILVLLHYWGGGASGVFAEAQWGGIVAAADQYGFIMVVPQTPDCWDANSTQSLTHNGGGQTEAIAHMVNYTVTRYHANADRVYVTGTSCGGMMTEALLAAYPDIFKAGAAFAGQAVGGAWTPVTHTAQQWGDIVRNAYPGYTGRRPRVQLWHGTADGIINYSNQLEAIMQWGNVLGLSVNPTTTTTGVKIGNITNDWTHQVWKDSCGNALLDAWSEIGGGHGTDANLNAQYVIPFLGLDHVGPADPVSPCDRPSGLVAAAASAGQINLVWNAFSNAASYTVKRSLTDGGPYIPVASGITATNYQDNGLAWGTMYYYVVSAMMGGNETSDSLQTATATLPGAYGSLVHRYSFSETGGTTFADSVGGPVWNGTLPGGGVLADGHLTLSAGSQQYASLPAGIVNSLSNFTIMAWVNLNSSSNWSRIFDFGNNTTTNMFLAPQNGLTGKLRFAMTTNGGNNEKQINCSSTLSTGMWHQVAVSLSGGTGILYLDGGAVGTNSGMTLNPASLGSTVNNYIGKSQYPDPCLDGSLDEFRIFKAALSPAEITATCVLGPNVLFGTNSPVLRLQTSRTNLIASWPVANVDFALQFTTNLAAGSWVTVTSPAPQIVDTNYLLTLPATNSMRFFRLSE